ncbi:MAG: hypothetical protein CVV49_01960 [Spirochaetae bacterium HGW-Spirochaetae-5]|nr:MAG: hypothetical protein CVV49_01960 [Spirochaetae bacterium HGW-Spirochaetae-5]
MKKTIFFITALLLIFSGCLNRQLVPENIPDSKINSGVVNFSYWLDEETGTVHKVAEQDGIETVVSIIRYRKEIPLEEMKILKSEYVEGKLHWIYYVPATGYTLEFTAVSKSSNSITIEWKNRNAEGEVDSGMDLIVRCNETGFIDTLKNSVEEEELPEDFSAFENDE